MENEKTFQNHTQVQPGDTVQRLMTSLAEAGCSNTLPRRIIAEVLADADGPLAPADILERGRQAHSKLGLVTVYRTLDLFARLGLAQRIHAEGDCHTYTLAPTGHGHHIVCRHCHAVTEFEGCDLSELFQSVTDQTGFQVTDHWLELIGECPRCRAGTRNQENPSDACVANAC